MKGEPPKPITSKPDTPFAANFIHNCVFPFMYNGVEYHTCTTACNNNWSAVVPHLDQPLGLGYGCAQLLHLGRLYVPC